MQPVPGTSTVRTVTPRNIYFDSPPITHVIGGRIDATYAYDGKNTGYETELREGTLMARLTASHLWVPCKRTRVNGATSNSAEIVVDDARAFKVGDVITVGAVTGLVITAIDYSTNTITTNDSGLDAADNAVVIGSGSNLAGSEIARGVLAEVVDLYDPISRQTVDRYAKIIDQGNLLYDQVLGDLDSCLASGVTNKLGAIRFYDDGVMV